MLGELLGVLEDGDLEGLPLGKLEEGEVLGRDDGIWELGAVAEEKILQFKIDPEREGFARYAFCVKNFRP